VLSKQNECAQLKDKCIWFITLLSFVDACFTVYPIIYLEIYFLLCDHSNLRCFYNTLTGGEILAYLLYKIYLYLLLKIFSDFLFICQGAIKHKQDAVLQTWKNRTQDFSFGAPKKSLGVLVQHLTKVS
jgi:hypothetical protein